jgi:hypothetical protein
MMETETLRESMLATPERGTPKRLPNSVLDSSVPLSHGRSQCDPKGGHCGLTWERWRMSAWIGQSVPWFNVRVYGH